MCGKVIDVSIGALCEQRDGVMRILVSRRPEGTVYAGYWEMPGGKIHEGETPAQCLVREFAEELGLTIEVNRALSVVEHVYPHGHVRLHPFYCRRVDGEPRNLQVADHRWVTPGELAKLKLPEANEPITQQVIAELTAPGGGPCPT